MLRRLAGLAVLSIAVAGCGPGRPSQIVLGRVENVTATQLWERTLSAVTSASYVPEVQDPNRGVIVVPSRALGSRARFVIQLYREGWVQVSHESLGRGFLRMHIPSNLAEEHVDLTIALRRAILQEPPPTAGDEAEPGS